MSLGLTAEKLLLILLIVAMLIGPERLPRYTSTVTRLAKAAKRTLHSAQQRVREEMGPEFDDIDWSKLDPRQYDPRRIVREALTDVWDPDDPLGLKEGNRPRQDGDEDFDGPGPGGTSWEGEKPHSDGGPAVARREANGNGSGVNLSKDVDLSKDRTPPPPAFDPDAT